MAARDETSELTDKQELTKGIDWHAICTTAGGDVHERVTASRKRRNQVGCSRCKNERRKSQNKVLDSPPTVNSLTLFVPIAFLIIVLLQADDDPLRLLQSLPPMAPYSCFSLRTPSVFACGILWRVDPAAPSTLHLP